MEEDDFSSVEDLDDSLLEDDLSCCLDFEESIEEEYYAYSRFDKFDHPKQSKSRKDKRKGTKKTSKRGTTRWAYLILSLSFIYILSLYISQFFLDFSMD